LVVLGPLSLAALADNIQTVAQYTSPNIDTGPFPLAAVTIGSFDILSDDSGITISGAFGNYSLSNPGAEQPTSAVNVYLGDIEVATCAADFMFCSGYDPIPDPWSYTLSAAQIASLGAGTVDLTAVQTAPYVIALGDTGLDQATTSTGTTSPSAVPEPSSFLLLGTGLLGIAGLFHRRFV
jgi:PEP-CTERM motif